MGVQISAIYNAGSGLLIGDVQEEGQHEVNAAPPLRVPEGCEGERSGIDQPTSGEGSEPRGRGREPHLPLA